MVSQTYPKLPNLVRVGLKEPTFSCLGFAALHVSGKTFQGLHIIQDRPPLMLPMMGLRAYRI